MNPYNTSPVNLCKLIKQSSFTYGTEERKLQDAIETLLKDKSVDFVREYAFDSHNRIDFLVGGMIGIEVKIKGAVNAVDSQLTRYAHFGEVAALILVTTKSEHKMLPQAIDVNQDGVIVPKPLYIVHLLGIM
jgi:hypothetical protein